MKYYVISEDILRVTLAYLIQRPYAEVAEVVAVLGQLQEIPVEQSEDSGTHTHTHTHTE